LRPEFFYSFVTSDCQGKVNPIEQRSEKKGSIPFCAGNFMSKIHGNGFAPFRFFTPFPRRPPRYISEGQWRENRMLRLLDSKTRIFFPSEEKDTRFQAPLSSPPERNRARSAFKRFFPPISLRRIGKLISLGQKLRVFGIHCPELSQTYSAADFIGFPRETEREG